MSAIEVVRDLRGAFGPVRDQGPYRQTCLALAASDLHTAVRGGGAPLSAEYLFFHAQRRAGRPETQPARLDAVLAALEHEGQPLEAVWPYASAEPAPASWAPPGEVGELFRRPGFEAAAALDQLVAWIDQGRPGLAGLTLSSAFLDPDDDGVVDPPPWEVPEPTVRHAVVAVGHGQLAGRPALLVRNSWGTGWGDGGYGWLSERFLKPRLLAIAVLEA